MGDTGHEGAIEPAPDGRVAGLVRKVEGRAEGEEGAATMINKRCCTMWSLKYSMSYTPMNDWVAKKVTSSPEAKQTERTRGHVVVRERPRA